jgi:hypothetical protein
MKRIVLFFLPFILLISLFSPVVRAEGGPPSVYLDGKLLTFEINPVIVNGVTLVPLRTIFEEQQAVVTWDESAQTITAEKDHMKITYRIGSSTADIDGNEIALEVPGQIINGSTLIPLRFVSEALGNNVAWLADSETVVISTSIKKADESSLEEYDLTDYLLIYVDKKHEVVSIYSDIGIDSDISGWRIVSLLGNQEFIIPSGTILKPGEILNIVSGPDAVASEGALVWTKKSLWNNDEFNPALLYKANGKLVDYLESTVIE